MDETFQDFYRDRDETRDVQNQVFRPRLRRCAVALATRAGREEVTDVTIPNLRREKANCPCAHAYTWFLALRRRSRIHSRIRFRSRLRIRFRNRFRIKTVCVFAVPYAVAGACARK